LTREISTPSRAGLAFLYATPIGLLGGLIGLGGAEFRLPVLAGPLGYTPRQAIPLNLAISLVTVAAAFLTRGRIFSLDPLIPLWSAILALIIGAVGAAFWGTALVGRFSDLLLERLILILLTVIGLALIVEGFLPQEVPGLLPVSLAWRVGSGLLFGVAIGLVSSLLGVAGGELIIPTLVFAYGLDIKTAGTASLLISFPMVLVGVVRYARQGAFARRQLLTETVAPMGLGSIIGAVAGGLLAGLIPAGLLKIALGLILNISARRIFHLK
jgi:uncharacterized membrane protein YfcA